MDISFLSFLTILFLLFAVDWVIYAIDGAAFIKGSTILLKLLFFKFSLFSEDKDF
jgi:hypothetical protein